MKPCREQKQLEFDEELLNCDSYDNLIYGRRLCQLNKVTFTLNVVLERFIITSYKNTPVVISYMYDSITSKSDIKDLYSVRKKYTGRNRTIW